MALPKTGLPDALIRIRRFRKPDAHHSNFDAFLSADREDGVSGFTNAAVTNDERCQMNNCTDDDDFTPVPATTDPEQASVLEKRKEKILASIRNNNGSLDQKTVFDFVDMELKQRENSGQTYIDLYLKGKEERDHCLAELERFGYKTWWESESLWYVIAVDRFSVSHVLPEESVLEASCVMEYVNCTIAAGRETVKRKRATVTINYDDELSVHAFSFVWER